MRAFIIRYPDPVCKPLGMRHGGLPPRGARPSSPCPHGSPHGAPPYTHVGGSTACQPPRSSRQHATPSARRSRSGSAVSSHPSRLHRDRPGTHTRARGLPMPLETRESLLFSSARVTAIDMPKVGSTTPRPRVTRPRPGRTRPRPTSGAGARSTPSGVKTRGHGSATTPCPPRHRPRREDGLRAHLVAADTPACALGLWRWTRGWRGCPGAAMHVPCTAYRRGPRASEVLRTKERESVPTCCMRCSHTVCSLPWIIEGETRDAEM